MTLESGGFAIPKNPESEDFYEEILKRGKYEAIAAGAGTWIASESVFVQALQAPEFAKLSEKQQEEIKKMISRFQDVNEKKLALILESLENSPDLPQIPDQAIEVCRILKLNPDKATFGELSQKYMQLGRAADTQIDTVRLRKWWDIARAYFKSKGRMN